jgi:DNA-binding GntR family transcriptional regulator
LNKKKHATMEQYVYQKIKEAILKRNIRPLSQLVETSIAEQLKVSRTPVRAAIRKLQFEGFVDIEPMRGAFVIKPTVKEIYDTFEVRVQLESYSAGLAAPLLPESDVAELEKLIACEDYSFQSKNFEAYNDANAKFHLHIASISGNMALHRHIKDLLDKTGIYLILFDPFYQIAHNPSMDEHRLILEQLRTGSREAAAKAMRSHLETTLRGLKLDQVGNNSEHELCL